MQDLKRFSGWFRGEALPLWADAGFHDDLNIFAERLGFDCKPVEGLPHRLMVQARQVSVFCDTERNGWMDGAGDIALRAAGTMVSTYKRQGSEGCWAFASDPRGKVTNIRADLYTHAFVLYALSRLFRMDGHARWRDMALETLDMVDRVFTHPQGGYLPALPADGWLLQNPVMHMLEAMLDLAESCGDDVFAKHAATLRQLALSRLIDPQTGALAERFDSAWNPRATCADSWVEPGHLYEWIWLLDWSEKVLGGGMSGAIAGLHRVALNHGYDRRGFLVDELELSGRVRKPDRRLWPHTEGARAELVLARRAGKPGDAHAGALVARLLEGFLDPAPPGGWIDRIDTSGKSLSPDIPASSLYHLAGAAAAIDTHIAMV